MKRSLIALATVLTAALCAALPLTWRADWPDAKPVETLVHRGTDVELQPTWFINKAAANTNGWTFTTFCQTNAVGPWFGPMPGAFFSHTNDVGAAFYNVMVRASAPGGAVNYTAFARLRMLDSPGFAPGELPLPAKSIDFADVEVVNAPYYTKAETEAKIVELAPAPSTATPAMDGAGAAGTSAAFARGDHVHPSDTSRVPTSRTVNGQPLSSDVTLDAEDVGALPSTTDGSNEYVAADVHFTGAGGDIDLPLGGTGTLTYRSRSSIPTQANLAAWGENGMLVDSGEKPSDFQSALTAQQLANIAAVPSKANDADVLHNTLGWLVLNATTVGMKDPTGKEASFRYVEGIGTFLILNDRSYFVPPSSGTLALSSDIDAAVSPTSPAFSNAVLSVGLGIDTNTVAVINELVDSAHDLPVSGATSVGALLLALAAAVAALKGNKADKPTNPTNGNLVKVSGTGELQDAGYHFEVRNGIPCIVQYT